MSARLEPPYDRGSPWKLVVGEETAVVSELTAVQLAVRHHITIDGKYRVSPLGMNDTVLKKPIQLSKKARRLLRTIGVKL